MKTQIQKSLFGTVDGQDVLLFALSNDKGVTIKITNYGGIITSIQTPDKTGKVADITLGFDALDGYLKQPPFFGCLVGRYANRIARGTFALEGKSYSLFVNNGPNSLHGGKKGFDKVVWQAREVQTSEGSGVDLSYFSKDMEEGYPGNLNVSVRYLLTDNSELKMTYGATTDKTTHVNLTNHAYFNLTGCVTDVMAHSVQINAPQYTPVDDVQIPTGELRDVRGTPFDFTTAKPIARDAGKVEGGYDHNFVLDNLSGKLITAATVVEPASGRRLDVLTTEPGIQFYTGNFLDGTVVGRHGPYRKHAGFCLEAQHYPDSPNQPEFPSTILKPGQTYSQVTVYKFS